MSELLDTIDDAIADWEAAPESWMPGDPIYAQPRGQFYGEQHVRPMFEIFHAITWTLPRCEPCQVSWRGESTCFVCGADRPLSVGWGSAITAWSQELVEISARMSTRLDEQLRELIAQAAPPLPPSALAVERLEASITQLGYTWPEPDAALWRRANPSMPRRGSSLQFIVLDEAATTAPTVADLSQGVDLSEYVADVERTPPVVPPPAGDDDTYRVRTAWGDAVLSRARYPRPERVLR